MNGRNWKERVTYHEQVNTDGKAQFRLDRELSRNGGQKYLI